MSDLIEIQLDVEELRNLLKVITRPRVEEFINKEINRLTSLVSDSDVKQDSNDVEQASDKPVNQVVSPVTKYYTDITNYAWDQSDKFTKIYITIGGTTISKESVTCDFKPNSYLLKIEDAGGKNYRQHVAHLCEAIATNGSFFKVRTDTVVLMLKKEKERHKWSSVTRSKANESKTPKFDEKKDPNESMMNLMKQMYEDGDDEMKRTIAKSFSESRNKTGAGDLGMGMDM